MIIIKWKSKNNSGEKMFHPNEFYGKGVYGDLDYIEMEDYIWEKLSDGFEVSIMDTENHI